MSYGVVLFHTTSSAIRAEKALKEKGFIIKLIPTPRQFSSDCGIALRFNWNKRDSVREALETALVEFNSIRGM